MKSQIHTHILADSFGSRTKFKVISNDFELILILSMVLKMFRDVDATTATATATQPLSLAAGSEMEILIKMIQMIGLDTIGKFYKVRTF